MVEAGARLPGCARFESFDVSDWLRHAAPLEKKIQLLRAPLPSVKELPGLNWQHAFEACFVGLKAPCLTVLNVLLWPQHNSFPWKVLEAAPALETLRLMQVDGGQPHGARCLKSVAIASRHGALLNLRKLEFATCKPIGGLYDERDLSVELEDVVDFADALDHSDSATGLASLHFRDCNLSAEGLRALAVALRRGLFPALKELAISGVVVLTDADFFT